MGIDIMTVNGVGVKSIASQIMWGDTVGIKTVARKLEIWTKPIYLTETSVTTGTCGPLRSARYSKVWRKESH